MIFHPSLHFLDSRSLISAGIAPYSATMEDIEVVSERINCIFFIDLHVKDEAFFHINYRLVVGATFCGQGQCRIRDHKELVKYVGFSHAFVNLISSDLIIP